MKRGQLSIGNLIGIFVLIALFGVLSSPISTFVELAQNNTGGLTSTTLSFILPLMAISIIWALFSYGKPYHDNY